MEDKFDEITQKFVKKMNSTADERVLKFRIHFSGLMRPIAGICLELIPDVHQAAILFDFSLIVVRNMFIRLLKTENKMPTTSRAVVVAAVIYGVRYMKIPKTNEIIFDAYLEKSFPSNIESVQEIIEKIHQYMLELGEGERKRIFCGTFHFLSHYWNRMLSHMILDEKMIQVSRLQAIILISRDCYHALTPLLAAQVCFLMTFRVLKMDISKIQYKEIDIDLGEVISFDLVFLHHVYPNGHLQGDVNSHIKYLKGKICKDEYRI